MAELVDNVALAFKMCNQQRERIAELEHQLAEEKEDFDVLDDQYHRLGEKYEALQWKPIIPENLPKVGDEVGGQDKMSVFMDRSFRNLLRTVSAYTQSNIAEEWHRLGYHYFRAINLPTETEHAQRTSTDGGNHGGPDAGLR